ncbi:unnamed protein product [Ilex paraguariensis]|uniref:Uncharacterized protein n=1 Tax=Ilex paraguariensis TaxID=185542 RepID=A0ABC8V513_9AQUA
MDVEAGEFQEWEVLHESDDDLGWINSPNYVENMRNLEEIEADSGGMIQTNYFSIDSQNKYAKTSMDGDVSEGSMESDNPSWIDPVSENRYLRKDSGEFLSDSSSDRSDDRKFNEFEGKNELSLVESEKINGGLKGTGEIRMGSENSTKFSPNSHGIGSIAREVETFEKNSELGIGKNANSQEGSELWGEKEEEKSSTEAGEIENVGIEAKKSGGEEENRSLVWWKLPMEFLKYCVFRVSPVWSLSVAVTVMGFVILGRRLYKMKRKSQVLELKVTVDDKVLQ